MFESKKNSFGCAANRKIGNRKSQRLNSTPTYYFGQCPSSSVFLKLVSEAGSVSVLGAYKERFFVQLGPLARASLNHWT
jgi:hypothetical protein